MKKAQLIIGAVALGLVGTSAIALADQPGSDWIPIEKAITILKKNGYSKISEIQADDGHWEGEGMKNGENHEFHVDPHSGKITKDQPDRDD